MKTVPLSGGKAAGRVALVDDADYEFVIQHRWHVTEYVVRPGCKPEGPYARTWIRLGGRRASVAMHRMLMPDPRVIDHEDGNGLNNQRRNLRAATDGQNQANAGSRRGSSSHFKGVSWNKQKGKWVANIKIDGRARSLGYFLAEEDAARAYDAAAREAWGEYARPNLP